MADLKPPRCVTHGHFWSLPDAQGVRHCIWCDATILESPVALIDPPTTAKVSTKATIRETIR